MNSASYEQTHGKNVGGKDRVDSKEICQTRNILVYRPDVQKFSICSHRVLTLNMKITERARSNAE